MKKIILLFIVLFSSCYYNFSMHTSTTVFKNNRYYVVFPNSNQIKIISLKQLDETLDNFFIGLVENNQLRILFLPCEDAYSNKSRTQDIKDCIEQSNLSTDIKIMTYEAIWQECEKPY